MNDISYLDWKKSFKKENLKLKSKKENEDLTESEFKEYLRKWKKKNLR